MFSFANFNLTLGYIQLCLPETISFSIKTSPSCTHKSFQLFLLDFGPKNACWNRRGPYTQTKAFNDKMIKHKKSPRVGELFNGYFHLIRNRAYLLFSRNRLKTALFHKKDLGLHFHHFLLQLHHDCSHFPIERAVKAGDGVW